MLKLLVLIVAILIFAILVAFLIAPNEKRDCSSFAGLMYAHRGLHEPGIPENSMAAFERARDAGYGVELDVQYTADGKIVVFHDANLMRMCGVEKKVSDCRYDELCQYGLKGTAEKIPLFEEVLKTLNDVPLICEIKNHNGNSNDKLCSETYDLLKEYKGIYCIESFSPFLVRWFRVNHPEVVRGQLSCSMKKEKENIVTRLALSQLLINVISRPDFIAYRHQDCKQPGFVLCRLFKPLLVGWTARGIAEQESAWKTFDSVIFEKYEDANPVE